VESNPLRKESNPLGVESSLLSFAGESAQAYFQSKRFLRGTSHVVCISTDEHDKYQFVSNPSYLFSKKNIALQPASTRFVISRKYSAFLVAVTDRDVIIEPHYDEVRRFATATVALALQNLSKIILEVRRNPDACDVLLEFYAGNGWKIEEADIEAFYPEF
jgi:hypothetical protein